MPCSAIAKADGHFHDPEFALAGHEQFEQDLVAVRGFGNGGGQFPPEGEKPRGGVVYVAEGAGKPVGQARQPLAGQRPSFGAAARYVAAADGDVAASVQHGGNQGRQPFRRVAQVRIHHDDDIARAPLPRRPGRTGEIRLFPAFDQPYIGAPFPGAHFGGCAIARAVVNKNDLETLRRQVKLVQARQQGVDVVGLVERGDYYGKLRQGHL